MTRKLNFAALVASLLFLSSAVQAQDSTTVRDFELWTGVSVKKSFLENKLSAELTQEFRLDDDASHMDIYFTELGMKYKFENGISLGAAYRYMRNNTNSGYLNERRFHFDLGYKYKIERFDLSARFRYSNRSEIGLSTEDGDYPINKYRFRLKAEYNIRNWKLDPYFAIETFYATTTNSYNYIESITETEEVAGFQKMRYTLGTSYKITDFMSLGAFYRIEKEFETYRLNYNTPATYYIGGINLNFKL
jgi:long-subunit fatty acid transport protein